MDHDAAPLDAALAPYALYQQWVDRYEQLRAAASSPQQAEPAADDRYREGAPVEEPAAAADDNPYAGGGNPNPGVAPQQRSPPHPQSSAAALGDFATPNAGRTTRSTHSSGDDREFEAYDIADISVNLGHLPPPPPPAAAGVDAPAEEASAANGGYQGYSAGEATPERFEGRNNRSAVFARDGSGIATVHTHAPTAAELDALTVKRDPGTGKVQKGGAVFDTTASQQLVWAAGSTNGGTESWVMTPDGTVRSGAQLQDSKNLGALKAAMERLHEATKNTANPRKRPLNAQEAAAYGFPDDIGVLHHSSLTAHEEGGRVRSGEVISAGEITAKEGRITKVTNASGHYRPSGDSLFEAVEQMDKRGLTSKAEGRDATRVQRLFERANHGTFTATQVAASGGDLDRAKDLRAEMAQRGRSPEQIVAAMEETLTQGFIAGGMSPGLARRVAKDEAETHANAVRQRYQKRALAVLEGAGGSRERTVALLNEAEVEFQMHMRSIIDRRRELEALRAAGTVRRVLGGDAGGEGGD